MRPKEVIMTSVKRNKRMEVALRPVKKFQKLEQPPKVLRLIEDFCRVTGLTPEDLSKRKKTRYLADARFVFANIAFEKYKTSERNLAKLLNVDHCTIHFYKKGMECPQKREIYLKIKDLIETLPWREQ